MRRLILGQVPAEETPAPAPTSLQALTNVRQFRTLIAETVGEPARAARGRVGLVLIPGRGYTLAYTFDPADAPAAEYAESLLWELPLTWGWREDHRLPPGPAARQLQAVELGDLS